ncbi:hypothetical protein LK03_05960 [Pseudomonas cremoricolorata]|uniref:Uncharacterized protein n=1 Tax=Pseudomonas cremoricolorata TaxID=157783 RepID=A0A089YAI6_9PSED|nr:hypothetical protein LK03_05960 [Pseudomonas cremoricolorata]
MKLVGSETEKKIRETLASSASYIFSNLVILKFLEKIFGSLSSAYVLGHTPDQGEDLYVVLVNGSAVVKFELSRSHDSEPEDFRIISVDEYRNTLRGRPSHIKLSIAIELSTGK